ncbi:hypothetical protein RDWZM_008394 [Blomia tropicalis]|uniref:Uncharacterized protein n=1 Tax=Blomia tropicalis TaxID=40697 RepID=A0A9Q0M1P1_BLOTA|nr:hypothetical protein RDWZM_008394 [Blomia tropicalis]
MARECCCCAAVVALFCPPLSVLMMEGCGFDFCLNLLLSCFFLLPGIIHAFIVLLRTPEPVTVFVPAPVVVNVVDTQPQPQPQYNPQYQQQYQPNVPYQGVPYQVAPSFVQDGRAPPPPPPYSSFEK